ncbi:PEGA domain-containing protein [Patescibacteria group bacterium]|nr:PEGA domain-containing protein [Patescibacteria group bacterium]MBU0776729.1 PEGA domain-containing protein [Patescibacteria group bacterium]MBU0846173.1 PEGA domain-containing protein [Patescibacteria group bacterium]MBU0922738.1 PEGA domain-containing protein [Patescibacteria group bacterium]MBU1066255.1 PEGA domain-containing protein [Patescibacteria group bacterium]
MKKLRAISIVLVVAGFILGIVFFVVGSFKPKSAGITIETVPAASIIIDGEQVGRTPYSGTRKPGEITIKLIPESFEAPLAPFETKVTLVAGIETIVKREFGESDETSSGEIISFEKIGGKEASLAVVSIPDAAQISIDGSIRGFAPYKTSSIVPGEHQVIVYAPGFSEKSFSLRTTEGYKLTAVVKLKPNGEEVLSDEDETPEEPKQEEVEILSTPTGFLRVRSEPSTAGEEVAQVEPGERYPYLDTDEDTGWFKIEYEDGEEGWVSNQYAKIIEPGVDNEEEEPSPTPTASPEPSPAP